MSDPTRFNDDGSVNITVDGQSVRYVKESDLLNVKGGSEAKAREWETEKASYNTQLAEANRLRDETHQQLLEERAARERLTQSQADYDALKTKAGELESQLGSAKESVSKYEAELAGRLRATLISGYGASEEAIKEKSLEQLRNLEEAAKVFGTGSKGSRPANFDGGSGSNGAPESSEERARRIIEAHEAKMGRPVQVSNAGVK